MTENAWQYAALKRCHSLDWLIEEIKQNMTSELRSVCWIEEMWNGDEILLGKTEVETARLCECIAGNLSKDFDLVITNKGGFLCCYDWRLGAA